MRNKRKLQNFVRFQDKQKPKQINQKLLQDRKQINEIQNRINKQSRQKSTSKQVFYHLIQNIEIKNLQKDEGQIMKQYEQRLIRMQKSLQDSDNLVSKYQKLSQQTSKNYQTLMNQLTNISNLVNKNFTSSTTKDNNQAVDQLCTIQKCKDFTQKLEELEQKLPDLAQFIKSIKKLSHFYDESLKKKRQSRLLFLKKQNNYQKKLQEQELKYASGNKQIQKLHQQIKNMQEKYEKKIQSIAKSKAKISEQKTNLQFIKQLFIKVLVGPKQASLMAFEVLSKVLKMNQDQYKTSHKKIK